jgi:hypothetical protein
VFTARDELDLMLGVWVLFTENPNQNTDWLDVIISKMFCGRENYRLRNIELSMCNKQIESLMKGRTVGDF